MRFIRAISVFLAAIVAWLMLRPRLLIASIARNQRRVLFYARTNKPVVALTIDDGPDPETTAQILDVLRCFNAKATFFLISDHIPENEAVVKRIIAERHEIGNHLTKDYPSVLLSAQQFEYELTVAKQILLEYSATHWFRPANAFYTRHMLDIAQEHSYMCVLGDILPLDVYCTSSRFVALYLRAALRPGSIITLHDRGDNGKRAVRTLEMLLPRLRQQGYDVVTVTDLFHNNAVPARRPTTHSG